MAQSPQYKIFSPDGEYIGCVKHGEDAACLVALYGDGATVRHGHAKRDTVWTEGKEEFPAAESYDQVATIMAKRVDKLFGRGGAS